MENNYAPQGTHNVGDVRWWDSKFSHVDRNGELVTIVKVIPYGDRMDLYKVVFDDSDVPVTALSNDFITAEEMDARKALVTA